LYGAKNMSGFSFDNDDYPETVTPREAADRLHQAGNPNAAAYLLSLPDDHPFTAERTQVTMAQQAKVSQLPAWQQREVYKRRNDFCDTRYIP
jgi:hypothetical protein